MLYKEILIFNCSISKMNVLFSSARIHSDNNNDKWMLDKKKKWQTRLGNLDDFEFLSYGSTFFFSSISNNVSWFFDIFLFSLFAKFTLFFFSSILLKWSEGNMTNIKWSSIFLAIWLYVVVYKKPKYNYLDKNGWELFI